MSHLNLDEINELKDIMEDGFGELVDAFIADSEEKLSALHDALAQGNATRVGELGHSLKGASGNICAAALADIYKQIEHAGRDQNLDGVADMVSQAEAVFQEVRVELQAL